MFNLTFTGAAADISRATIIHSRRQHPVAAAAAPSN